ncbi:hypothetical protein AJ85_04410 [Alkalihalobacillus alcalophilus ATCC 27647 = CGMCC 1.3604]|uniref:Uncharacterized protein n=1 Tax=Alkalihalobacillus alcalophilus ATCC 27647 = CGMCC 1.3604 TaxID=1218173 RepID=A0A094WMV7_ALKAL|nr:hypothetical protein [Alkalihalobacillus alcalophilus]KGA97278.1 hypothetical protein BALCAV_0211285 [Alkalihalobacillus alcalophilus ATCC 27647 = CGMCC 1.3604]MED1562801.1 hypothetical protein [Alkalihalobacillus alcalophilus]THG91532.1 hypothetical protein AJ85_04410 [Alkalihalobacillus alcalophilus ATCC 27647 = CGMCC 1.3604]
MIKRLNFPFILSIYLLLLAFYLFNFNSGNEHGYDWSSPNLSVFAEDPTHHNLFNGGDDQETNIYYLSMVMISMILFLFGQFHLIHNNKLLLYPKLYQSNYLKGFLAFSDK